MAGGGANFGDAADNGNASIVVMLALYAIEFAFVSVQLGRIFYYRHNFRSFQFTFLLLVFLWTFFRILYLALYLSTIAAARWLISVVFLVPISLQFATFSLLVLFYVSLVHEESWNKKYGRNSKVAWALGNVVIAALPITEVLIEAFDEKKLGAQVASVQIVVSCIVFFSLIVLLAVYGYKLAVLTNQRLKNRVLGGMRITKWKVVAVTFALFCVFFTRFGYDFLAAFWGGARMNVTDPNVPGGMSAFAFGMLLLWEILPTAVVLLVFRVPPTGLGFVGRLRFLAGSEGPLLDDSEIHDDGPDAAAAAAVAAVAAVVMPGDEAEAGNPPSTERRARGVFFSNPRRYDSDKEAASPIRSGSAATTPRLPGRAPRRAARNGRSGLAGSVGSPHYGDRPAGPGSVSETMSPAFAFGTAAATMRGLASSAAAAAAAAATAPAVAPYRTSWREGTGTGPVQLTMAGSASRPFVDYGALRQHPHPAADDAAATATATVAEAVAEDEDEEREEES